MNDLVYPYELFENTDYKETGQWKKIEINELNIKWEEV